MSERPVSTGKIVVLGIVGVAAALALGIVLTGGPRTHACVAEEGPLGNFEASVKKPVMPDTVFFDGEGKEIRLTDFKGRGVVLNFWATWCAPCVREMPQLDKLKTLVAGDGIDVLTVSEDRQGVPLVKKFYATNKLENLAIHIDKGGKLLRALKGRGLPTTVLFNKSGQEVGRVAGIAEWDAPEAVEFIQDCLGS